MTKSTSKAISIIACVLIQTLATNAQDNKKRTEHLRISTKALIEQHHVPDLSIRMINNGHLGESFTAGVLQVEDDPIIDDRTVFSWGSVSKFVTAVAVLRLVADGQLELDRDVNEYLESWKVPQNRFTEQYPVTIRTILSHTAGLSVHGFADFQPGQMLPTTVQILNGEHPAMNRPVRVIQPVGEEFKYSGGGTTILQLIVEETTRMPFPEAVSMLVFEPLALTRSTFENPLPEAFGNIAKAHDDGANPQALPRGYQAMPEMAASGLWSCPTDVAKILIAVFAAYTGKSDGFLPKDLVVDMMSTEANSEYGLGIRILDSDYGFVAMHGGSNESYRSYIKLYLDTGNGYAITTNGADGHRVNSELFSILDQLVHHSGKE
jgi:CubicO group peptidase (beta-lactamase class C family)